MNLSELKDLLGTYKLERAGKKLVILERLIAFSQNPNTWNRFVVLFFLAIFTGCFF